MDYTSLVMMIEDHNSLFNSISQELLLFV